MFDFNELYCDVVDFVAPAYAVVSDAIGSVVEAAPVVALVTLATTFAIGDLINCVVSGIANSVRKTLKATQVICVMIVAGIALQMAIAAFANGVLWLGLVMIACVIFYILSAVFSLIECGFVVLSDEAN